MIESRHKGMPYRPDIDGLRAVAIVPVVLYHLSARGFGGGFIGVDVFFVISGFLITGIIQKELSIGQFSIKQFYRRRILRVFPALFSMIFILSIICFIIMLPTEFVRYGYSVLTTAFFSSNIYFNGASGYFSPSAQSIPLIHTWSLAVEEQYYILWPLLLMVLKERPWAVHLVVIGGLFVLSLAFAIYLLAQGDEHSASAAFYLLPSRFWELLLGAGVALWLPRHLKNPLLREPCAAGGLALIFIAVKFYSHNTPFPGVAALVPCLGAAAIIAAGASGASLVYRILSLRPVTFIGRISYSLYLWHWPVLVIANIGLYLRPSLLVGSAEFALSVLLATLSWWFIERPFRVAAGRLPTKLVLAGGGATMLAASALGLTLVLTSGFPGRLTADEGRMAAFEAFDGDSAYRGGTCFMVRPEDTINLDTCLTRRSGMRTVLLVGDSHAADLWPGLASAPAENLDILQATMAQCPPLFDPSAHERCREFYRRILEEWLPAHPVDVVVLSGRWQPQDVSVLPSTLAKVRPFARHILLIGPVPSYLVALPRLLVKFKEVRDPSVILRAIDEVPFEVDPKLKKVADAAGVDYLSLVDLLCRGTVCLTELPGDVPLQFDYGHLTPQGSVYVGRVLLNRLKSLEAQS